MKNLLRSTVAAATLSLTLALAAHASDDAGYVDMGQLLPASKGQFVEINLSPAMLKFAARVAKHHEPEAAELLGEIKRIRVNVVSLDDSNRAENIAQIEAVRAKLEQQGWSRMVTVRENNGGDDVAIFSKIRSDETIDGLVVTVIDRKGEAVFVNIVGNISADKIGALAEKYDIAPLRKVKLQVSQR